MTETRTYKNQFQKHDWPPRRLATLLVFLGWEDSSWGNDVAPSFEKDDLRIWCDFKLRATREFPDAPRYSVFRQNDEGEHVETLFECEKTCELIAWLKANHERIT